MKATLHRSNRTGGTTVGSTETCHQVGLLNSETSSRTLAADDHSHAVVPHLSRKRQESLRKFWTCREVLESGKSPVNYPNERRHTLWASSTTNTLPAFPRSALVKIRVTISNNPQADFGSIKGSERSTIVS